MCLFIGNGADRVEVPKMKCSSCLIFKVYREGSNRQYMYLHSLFATRLMIQSERRLRCVILASYDAQRYRL